MSPPAPRHSDVSVVIISDAIIGRNGVGAYYRDLVEHLRPRVRRLTLIAPEATHPESHQGVSTPIPGDSTQRIYLPRGGRLWALMEEAAPDVVVLPTIGPYTLVGLRYARKLGAAVCVAQHTDFGQLARLYCPPGLAWICRTAFLTLNRYLIRRSAGVVAVAKEGREAAERLGATDVRVVGTPVSPQFIRTAPTAVTGELRKVLYLGRLAPEKNVPQVLEAAAKTPELQFIIGGDGPLRGQVETRARKLSNLDYRGWLPRTEVMEVLDECDLLILPSEVEAFGTVALEAMARGRLVLASAACGIRDWPDLARSVYFMHSGESATDALARVAAAPADERRERAAAGRAAAEAMNESALGDWLQLFDDLAGAQEELSPRADDAAESRAVAS